MCYKFSIFHLDFIINLWIHVIQPQDLLSSWLVSSHIEIFFHFNVHVLIHLSLKSLFLQCSRFYIVSDEFYCIIPCTNFPHTKYIVLLASPKPSEAEIEPDTHYRNRMMLNKVHILIYWHACGLMCQNKKNNFDRKWTVPALSFHNYYHFRTFLVFSKK